MRKWHTDLRTVHIHPLINIRSFTVIAASFNNLHAPCSFTWSSTIGCNYQRDVSSSRKRFFLYITTHCSPRNEQIIQARVGWHADPFSWIFPGPQILLPRSAGEQVNTSFLDLGNFSTTAINISSADSTLVLKVHYDIFTFISWMWRGVRTRFKNQPPFFRIVLKVCLHSVALIVIIFIIFIHNKKC